MEPGASLTPVALDEQGRVAADLPCVRCGYNLRGLPASQGCPECGTTITLSLRGEGLVFRDPAWVARLARGAAWMLAGFGGYIVMGNVGYSLLAGLGPWGVNGGLLAFIAVGIVGIWQIASPDPGGPANPGHADPRWLVRALLVAAVWLTGVVTMLSGKSLAVLLVPGVLAFISLFGCLGALLVHMRRITEKIPSRSIALQMRILLWLLGIAAGMRLVADVVQGIWPSTRIMVGPNMTWAGRWIGTFHDLGNILIIVYYLWFVALLIAFTRVLRRVARQARGNWLDVGGYVVNHAVTETRRDV